ncbi:MAG: glycoside hydrolase family 16 protein [Bryobacteraceae bacterium]|nr:glycoside hydrolase family 16 protein [Solibacteraceae bacterium]MCO5349613.1 glycoside hydrolase family 16 protein [Bryobacteraceae bacterium]
MNSAKVFQCLPGLVLLAAVTAAAQGPARLVWSDEFDRPGLPDPAKWAYQTGGHGWGNQEKQYYTEARAENARVENGHLLITARREAFEGREYTSARLVTAGRQTWRYGYFEIRAKLPCGRGTWPAIWMLGTDTSLGKWPAIGEIDIMEHVGHDPERVHATIHCTAYNHTKGTQKGGFLRAPGVCADFHVYAVNWTPEFLEFYLDGRPYFRFANEGKTRAEWPFDQPFYLLLNVAVGGTWGGQKGVDDEAFPQTFAIDYVRVYDRKPE